MKKTLLFLLLGVALTYSETTSSQSSMRQKWVVFTPSLLSSSYTQNGQTIKVTNIYKEFKILYSGNDKALRQLETYQENRKNYAAKNVVGSIFFIGGVGAVIPGAVTANIPLVAIALGLDLIGAGFIFLAIPDSIKMHEAFQKSIFEYNSALTKEEFDKRKHEPFRIGFNFRF